MSSQNNIILIQTKHPAQKWMNTVKIIETINDKPTQMASKGHPYFKSEKHYCSAVTLMK